MNSFASTRELPRTPRNDLPAAANHPVAVKSELQPLVQYQDDDDDQGKQLDHSCAECITCRIRAIEEKRLRALQLLRSMTGGV